jgi:hypothetical protein
MIQGDREDAPGQLELNPCSTTACARRTGSTYRQICAVATSSI